MKKAALFLAEGFEEIEAIIPIDVLRRANIEVTTISISNSNHVTGAHQITIHADTTFEEADCNLFDAIVLPGGMPGSHNLNAHQKLKELLLRFSKDNKLIAAICAAPLILGELGLLKNINAVCYPGFEHHLTGANLLNQAIVKDKNFISANGAGSAMLFALSIVEELLGSNEAKLTAEKMLVS